MDWSDCDIEKVPYRRIEDYVASMTKPKADQHGLVHDLEFDKKFDVVRSAAKRTLYKISMLHAPVLQCTTAI